MILNKNFIPTFTSKLVYNLIFVRIPKNASTSIYNHLGEFNLIHKHREKFFKNFNNKLYRNLFDPTHAKPQEIKDILPVNVHDYFSFAVVRNPWDRFVSMYGFTNKMNLWEAFGYKKSLSFDEFVNLVYAKYQQNEPNFFATQNQIEWLDGAFKVKKILFFENLQHEFSQMLLENEINHINSHLPHLNSSDRKNYRQYYNDKTKYLVAEIFAKDLDKFDYQF